MLDTPPFGLGAAALRKRAAELKEEDETITDASIAEELGVSAAAFFSWKEAGWLEGGSVPRSRHRRRIAEWSKTNGEEIAASLFDRDEDRRAQFAADTKAAGKRAEERMRKRLMRGGGLPQTGT